MRIIRTDIQNVNKFPRSMEENKILHHVSRPLNTVDVQNQTPKREENP